MEDKLKNKPGLKRWKKAADVAAAKASVRQNDVEKKKKTHTCQISIEQT